MVGHQQKVLVFQLGRCNFWFGHRVANFRGIKSITFQGSDTMRIKQETKDGLNYQIEIGTTLRNLVSSRPGPAGNH